jgi:hypothetical protein
MQLGIIGLARSGKTTVFNAVTRSKAAVGGYSDQPNVGVVTVPDARVDRLSEMYRPKKTTYATIQYVDFPAAGANFGKGEGPGGKFLNELARMDALIHVVRGFSDPAVPHPDGDVNPGRDIETMDLELTFADLAMLEKRLDRLNAEVRSMKAGERDQAARLQAILQRIQGELENEVPVRAQTISDEEERLLSGSRFMTRMPMLILLNVGEEDLERRLEIESALQEKYRAHGRDAAVVAGRFEMELNDLSDAEAEEFRASAGVTESGMAGAIRLSYSLLGLVSFLTTGPDECRAWTVEAGSTAPVAAGKIHSDLQRGFIRAEVVSYDDLVAAGSEAEAKKRGQMRTEGKEYVVKDGDVLHILFNV